MYCLFRHALSRHGLSRYGARRHCLSGHALSLKRAVSGEVRCMWLPLKHV